MDAAFFYGETCFGLSVSMPEITKDAAKNM